ncbi:MAG: alpha/beta hydrolase family protein [Anaerolineales bacterium]
MLKRLVYPLLVMLGSMLVFSPATAQRPDAPTYGQTGPYTVGTQELMLADEARPLPVTIWYPTQADAETGTRVTYRDSLISFEGNALADAPPASADGPYPLVIYSHGSMGYRFVSSFFTEHLASYGFVVLAPNHPGNTAVDSVTNPQSFVSNIGTNYAQRPLDVLRVLDFAEALTAPEGDLAGLIDMERVAVTGHSFGGYTTLSVAGAQLDLTPVQERCEGVEVNIEDFQPSFMMEEDDAEAEAEAFQQFSCLVTTQIEAIAEQRGLNAPPDGPFPSTSDPRIDAIITMAPSGGEVLTNLDAVDVPALTLVGSLDATTPPQEDAYVLHAGLGSAPSVLVTFTGAGHYVFIDECIDLFIAFGAFGLCSDPVWDMQRVHDLTNHFSTAFLLWQLQDDTAAENSLTDDTVDFRMVEFERAP